MAITATLSGGKTLRASMESEELSATFKGPLGSGTSVRIGEVTLLSDGWVGTESPYSQVVTISGVTKYSLVDLQLSVEQLSIFHDNDLAFTTENDGGIITVYAVGDKPADDYTIQVTIMEVKE